MLSFGMVPIHLNVLHPKSLFLRSSPLGMVVDIVCQVDTLHTLLLYKVGESDDDSFRLHSFELLEINVADPFVS